MATTKETMKVIAMGIDDAEGEYELSDVEKLVSEIVFEVAEKTSVDCVQSFWPQGGVKLYNDLRINPVCASQSKGSINPLPT